MPERWIYGGGFTVFDSAKPGPLFIAPHAGLNIPFSFGTRDRGTESVAYYAAKKGGICIVSTIGRERKTGIDFYRIPPTEKTAINAYDFFEYGEKEKIKDFRKKYAFAAKDVNQFRQKITIYRSFWEFISSVNNPFFIFIHAHSPHIKNHPSLMDITSFEERGFENKILKEAVQKVNEGCKETFKKLKHDYDKFILEYLDRWFEEKIKNSGGLESIEGLTKEVLNANLESISKYASREIIELLNKNFNKETLKLAVENALVRADNLEITIEKIFKGKLAEYVVVPMLKVKRAIGIQIEVSEFLTVKRPEFAAELIWKIIEECKKIIYRK